MRAKTTTLPKVIVTPDGTFRWRRGKLVRIPDEWVGKTVSKKTINKRQSKLVRRGRARPATRKPVKP